MSKRTHRATSTSTVETYTLTLIYRDGRQTPVGTGGNPFHHWTVARDALADMVRLIGGVEELHGVSVTTTQSRGGELLVVSIWKYNRDEIAEICCSRKGFTRPGSTDGHRLSVTLPP